MARREVLLTHEGTDGLAAFADAHEESKGEGMFHSAVTDFLRHELGVGHADVPLTPADAVTHAMMRASF